MNFGLGRLSSRSGAVFARLLLVLAVFGAGLFLTGRGTAFAASQMSAGLPAAGEATLLNAANSAATSGKYRVVASYTGPNGVAVISYSTAWADRQKLRDLYNELLANYHGAEITDISSLNILPDYPYGRGVRGMYHGLYTYSGNGRISLVKKRPIDLYGGDEYPTVAEMAKTLSHEYGHHFTIYYLLRGEGKTFENWRQTRWAKLRGLTNRRETGDGDHAWSPEEIAAEDYVQLFGSPAAHRSTEFKGQYGTFTNDMYNLSPQENLELPLAAQVSGLRDYWRSLMGTAAAGPKLPSFLPPSTPTLALTGAESRYGLEQLTFSWSRSLSTAQGGLEYTLVYYQKGDSLAYPVLTTVNGYQAAYLDDGSRGKRLFRVFVKDSAGQIVSSNVLEADLADPKVTEPPLSSPFRDVSPAFWAFSSIKDLVEKGCLQGFPDLTFRADKPVSRAEFVVALGRALGWQEDASSNPFKDARGQWYSGMVTRAWKNGIISGDLKGSFLPLAPITRAEATEMLDRSLTGDNQADVGNAASPAQRLTDIDGHWAQDAILRMQQAGIVTGQPDGRFYPDASIKRAEVAVILERLLSKE